MKHARSCLMGEWLVMAGDRMRPLVTSIPTLVPSSPATKKQTRPSEDKIIDGSMMQKGSRVAEPYLEMISGFMMAPARRLSRHCFSSLAENNITGLLSSTVLTGILQEREVPLETGQDR
jgi:hypothetical protein